MLGYTLPEWLLIFYIYCFLGWCFETTYVSLRTGHRVNRGFMRAPMLPLYGSGALLLLVIGRVFSDNMWLAYIVSCIGAMLLELVTGITMEWLFKIKYWDYSRQKIQYKGHICLSSTLVWGLFGLLVNRVLHEPIEGLVLGLPKLVAGSISFAVTVWLGLDLVQSFREAWRMRKILINLELTREDILKQKKQISYVIALDACQDQNNLRLRHILRKQRHAMEGYLQELWGILYNIQKELTARYEVHLSIFKKI